jgi:nitrite reductase (NADH) small subunit
MAMAWTSLCELDELVEGEGKYVEIDGFRLAVFLHKGQVYAMDNTCPHAGGNMSGGVVDEQGCAVCPWHGWAFRLDSGEMPDAPVVKIDTYRVRLLKRDDGRPDLVQADLPSVQDRP